MDHSYAKDSENALHGNGFIKKIKVIVERVLKYGNTD